MTFAFLLINSEFLFTEEVMNKLKEIPEIVDIYIEQGLYDIIAKVKLNSEEELKELVSERIRKVDKITGTVTGLNIDQILQMVFCFVPHLVQNLDFEFSFDSHSIQNVYDGLFVEVSIVVAGDLNKLC
jgi:hypothetical protein